MYPSHRNAMDSACASPDWVAVTKSKRPAGAGNVDAFRARGQLKKPRIVYDSKRHRDPFNLSAADEKQNEAEVADDTAAAKGEIANADTITIAATTQPKVKRCKQEEITTTPTSTKWYQVEKIVRQRQEDGKSETQYLVKWAGKQANSKPWPCSWEEESHISSALLHDWKVEVERRKGKPDKCESGKPVKLGAQVIGECPYDAGKVSLRICTGREMMVNWENVRFGDLMAWDGV
ncbi:hypothetical protein AC579_4466 [Pseudocercospora musae]|uniref:Chromo domain-containing protein n=1 Tax=Pseudocercospora musae TaxID=113226 RepID=A0A139GZ51_9PEZI|nr:hypothetical protein AC579_4466 [Pseudocercospora musae]